VIEHFSNGIKAKWQFQAFYNDNAEIADDFKCTVQKLIASEERTQERFPDQQDNHDNRGNNNRGNQGV